ncbi:hypothetical protein [Peribacillus acanthi]|uniref:hypothetical protein n=1 Tax=Peribacillus acanthi TaxID=2171554 RepID=UPI000D3E0C04|nr:hypothetical protein [Peribacillus acanthi]
MPMEQETMSLLIGGFSIVMGITVFIVVLLFLSKNRKPNRTSYGLVLAHLGFLSWAISHSLSALRLDIKHSMASEEISLRLGTAGVLWAISMLFLIIALIKFPTEKIK